MVSETIQERNARQYAWQKDNYERVNFLLPKGSKEVIQALADAEGVKISTFLRQAIRAEVERRGAQLPPEPKGR